VNNGFTVSAWPWGNDIASWVWSFCSKTSIAGLTSGGAPILTSCAAGNRLSGYIGTSEATAHVSGLAALLVADHGRNNPSVISQLIASSAEPILGQGVNHAVIDAITLAGLVPAAGTDVHRVLRLRREPPRARCSTAGRPSAATSARCSESDERTHVVSRLTLQPWARSSSTKNGSARCAAIPPGFSSTATHFSRRSREASRRWLTPAMRAASFAGIDWTRPYIRPSHSGVAR